MQVRKKISKELQPDVVQLANERGIVNEEARDMLSIHISALKLWELQVKEGSTPGLDKGR